MQKQTLKRQLDDHEAFRFQHLTLYEERAKKEGYKVVAGVDEAGRGPLAGPVVAASCHIPSGVYISGVNDSKKLTPKLREKIFEELKNSPEISYGIGIVDHSEIDEINIYQATIRAMLKAVDSMPLQPDYLLIDGLPLPHLILPSNAIVKGDSKSLSIAAASIIAKETRDQIMIEYHKQFPEYGFDKHKGYATRAHRDAIKKYGPCPIHRTSFEPIKSMVSVEPSAQFTMFS
ncbi:MAG: ribonuclease HII [Chlamydiota bacterium]|nr:ribonuclease HII [Chlamydiota bacterium]